MYKEKPCAMCKTNFKPKSSKHTYCDKCKSLTIKTMCTCGCNREFDKKLIGPGSKRKCYGNGCQNHSLEKRKDASIKLSGKNNPGYMAEYDGKFCPVCNKPMSHHRASSGAKTCSFVCGHILSNKNRALEKHYKWKGYLGVKNCERCSKPLTRDQIKAGSVYCSSKCSQKFAGGSLNHPKRKFDKELGHTIRSSWEKVIADLLHRINVSYKYEERFSLKFPDGTIHYYHPDFLFNNTIYEVKGRFYDETTKLKLKLFKEQYPQYKLFLIGNPVALGKEVTKNIHYDCLCSYKEMKKFLEVNS